jgi:hypothetical protein
MRYEPVPASDCVVAFGVFADYDGAIPDSKNVVLCSSAELAEEVAQVMGDRFNNMCVADGWEWAKKWAVAETVARRWDVICSLDELLALAESEGWGD